MNFPLILPRSLKVGKNSTVFVSPVKTGTQEIYEAPKYWMCSLASLAPPPFGPPAGVYPDANRGRNDVKQRQTNFFKLPLLKGEIWKIYGPIKNLFPVFSDRNSRKP